MRFNNLTPRRTPGAQCERIHAGKWRLQIPAGPAGRYRLAQVDDYGGRPRKNFPWQPPFSLELTARASAAEIPGTWGFGVWNDPFGMAFLQGGGLHLPTLPNAAWFFFASQPNYLSLRDDLPATGALAATFCAPRWPPALLALGLPFAPFLFWRPGAQILRRVGRRVVRQDAVRLDHDPRVESRYAVRWETGRVVLAVDDRPVLATAVAPQGPLGVVIWVDNQYAALPPDDRVRFGTLAAPEPAWIEIGAVRINGEEVYIDRES